MNPKATKLIVAGLTSATLLSGVGAVTVSTATAADIPLIAPASQNWDDLTGIDINGSPLEGFSTTKTDYEVTVPTLSSMTTTPKFANQKTTTVATVAAAPSGVHGVVVNIYDTNSSLVKTYTIHVTETEPEQPSVDIAALKKTLQDAVNAMQAKLDDWHTQYANKDAMTSAIAQGKEALKGDDATAIQSAIDALGKVDTSKSTQVTAIGDALKDLYAQQKRFNQYSDELAKDIAKVTKYADQTATSLDDDTAKAREIKQVIQRMQAEELRAAKDKLTKAIKDAQAKLDNWKITFDSGRAELEQAVSKGQHTLQTSNNPDEVNKATEAITGTKVTTSPTKDPVLDAQSQLNTELAKGFTYSDTLSGKIRDAKAITGTDASSLAEARERAQHVLDTLHAIQGHGNERLAYDTALDKAGKIDPKLYLNPAANTLSKAIADQKQRVNPDKASAQTLNVATAELTRDMDALRPSSWSVDGVKLSGRNGTWTGALDHTPQHPQAVAGDNTTTPLTYTQTQAFVQGSGQLGVGTQEGELTGSWRDQQFTVHVADPVGTETTGTVNGHSLNAFTLQDGVWTAHGATELGNGTDLSAVPDTTVTLTDGTKLSTPQVGKLEQTNKDGTTVFTRELTFTGKDSHGTPVNVVAAASSVFNDQLTVTLHQTNATGDTKDIQVASGKVADLNSEYTLDPLPFEANADQFSLSTNTGANVRDVHVAQGVLDNGTRVFTITYTADTLQGAALTPATHTMRVTVPFAQPKQALGNLDAALETITVNNQPIAGFNDNQVDYTVHIGGDEKVKLSPKPKPGQTVVAGDITQTAYTTKQSWTVTKGGQQRVYTVTVVRDHTQPTADEAFTPGAFDSRVSDKPNPSPANTDLASVGFSVNGEYTPQDGTTITVPEGGVFGYESYVGQVVTEQSVKTGPMTYKVTLGVLSADRDHWEAHEYTVTYLTKVTHKAELTGISVDGVALDTFHPDQLEYTVGVDNPDRYTVVPLFDKMSGMAVSTHKDGHTVTITVTSADGLVTRTYTLHVMSKPAAQLAETGANVVLVAGAAIVAAIAGLGFALWKRSQRNGTADVDDTPEQ